MPAPQYQTFGFTLRPTDGVTDEQIDRFLKWGKKLPGLFAITHKSGKERHLHTAFILDKPWYKSNLQLTFLRMYPELTDNEKVVLRKGVKLWYNWEFVDRYLTREEEEQEVIFNNLDGQEPPFPPPDDTSSKRPVNPWYDDREKEWKELYGEELPIDWDDVASFLNKRMYADREIQVIADPRLFANKVHSLYNWLHRYEGPNNLNGKRLKTCDDEKCPGCKRKISDVLLDDVN